MAVRSINFEVAAEEVDQTDEDLIDATLVDKSGRSLGAAIMVRQPSQGAFARLSVAYNRSQNIITLASSLDDMLGKIIVSPEEAVKIKGFEDRTDFVDASWVWDVVADDAYDFDTTDVISFIGDIAKQFSGFPTKPSSGSTSSQPKTGKSSTAGSRRAGSTRSSSRSVASAT
jgi:hypothetical protein